MKLRNYQEEALNAAHDSLRQYDSALGIMATGGGKTTVFSILANHCTSGWRFDGSGRVLILVNRKQLLRQTAIEVQAVAGVVPALEQGDHNAPLHASVVVASIDSLANRLAKYPRDHFKLMVVDEAHLMTGKRCQKVFEYFQCKRFGCTATPNNKGKKALHKFYDHVAFDIPLLRLIKEGYLCPITVAMSPLKIDLNGLKMRRGDFDEEDLETTITPYFDAICQEMMKYPHRKWLCFLPRIDSSKKFSAALNSHGFRSAHVDGENDPTVELELYHAGKLDVLTCSTLLHFGYNHPPIDGIVNLRQTKSINFYEQLIGRGTRKSEDTLKHELLVLDFLWQYQELGLVRPAFVLSKTEEEAREMQRRIEKSGKPVDLGQLQENVERDLYAKLQEKLRENARKKKRLINVGQVVEGNPELENYQPELIPIPPSAAQIAVLQRHGIDVDQVTDRGHASRLIDFLHNRIELGLASQRQLAMLRRLGIQCDNETTFSYASWLLDQRLKKKEYAR